MENKYVELVYKNIETNIEYEKIINIVIDKCFEEEKMENLNLYISITLTTSEEIQKINNEFRNIDKETDVLSFPMFEKEEIEEIIKNSTNKIQETIGDVVVCVERVKQQAKDYGHSFERELAYMIVHGFYHLMGYDHMEENEKLIMRQKEENILEKLNINR